MTRRSLALFAYVVLLAGCRDQTETAQAPVGARTPPATAADPAPTPPTASTPADDSQSWVLSEAFTADTTPEQLRQRYGDAQVSVQDVPGAEGETFRGVVLFSDDPVRRATLYFHDEQALKGLSMVTVSDTGSRWKLASGLAIGAGLAQVQAANGKAFTFSGFDWDYGGTVLDWRGGRLQSSDAKAVSEHLQLRMPEGGSGDKPYPMGDGEFDSDDPRWKDLGIGVGEISVGFPEARR